MSCCIGRRNPPKSHTNQQVNPLELKNKLQSIDSQRSMVDVFTSIMESDQERTTLYSHFEKQHSPELPYFIKDFITWEKEQTKEGAENLFKNYFNNNSPYQLDIENGDDKRIRFLLNDYTSNRQPMYDMFEKYAMKSTKDIKANYNPKLQP